MLYNKDAKRFRQATMMGGGALRLDDEPAPKKPMSAAQMLACSVDGGCAGCSCVTS